MRASGYKIEMLVRRAQVEAIGAALDDMTIAIAAFETVPGGLWRIEAYTGEEPERAVVRVALDAALGARGESVPPFDIAPLPSVDWLAENRRSFPALRIGRFRIHGSHITDPPPIGSIDIKLDAATAFGSGEHATTRGCLVAIDRAARRKPVRLLDVGCGSGILSIAMAKRLRRPVLASDLDAEAVRVAAENARHNRVAGSIQVVRAAGYRHRLIRHRRPYDLVAANILARPLCMLARDLSRHLAPDGRAILSGLLAHQEPMVLAAHRQSRLVLDRHWRSDGWSALTLRRRGMRAATSSGRRRA